MVQNFREIAKNHMNVNFRDKNFVITKFFHDYCYSAENSRCRSAHNSYTWRWAIEVCKCEEKLGIMTCLEFQSCIRGFHVYKSIWTPFIGETLSCSRETSNLHDPFAVKVLKTDEIVGHLPKRISSM